MRAAMVAGAVYVVAGIVFVIALCRAASDADS